MVALATKTAGVAKKMFMKVLYPNCNNVKVGKMEDAYINLMNDANRLEETHLHIHGRPRPSYTSGQQSSALSTWRTRPRWYMMALFKPIRRYSRPTRWLRNWRLRSTTQRRPHKQPLPFQELFKQVMPMQRTRQPLHANTV